MMYLQKVGRIFSLLRHWCSNSGKRLARRPPASSKSQIVIRRPAHCKPHPRARLTEESEAPSPSTTLAEASGSSSVSEDQLSDLSSNELIKIRDLLRPPPIPGVPDWGIPAASTEPCDPAIEVLGYSPYYFHVSHIRSSGQTCTIPHFEKRPASTETLQ